MFPLPDVASFPPGEDMPGEGGVPANKEQRGRGLKLLGAMVDLILLFIAAPLVIAWVIWFQVKAHGGELLFALSTEGKANKKKLAGRTQIDALVRSAVPEHPSLGLSVLRLAQEIKAGTFTSEEVVRAYIRQSIRAHGCTNALKSERYAEALAEAKRADRMLKATREQGLLLDSLPPFLGVPISAKESFAIAGLLQTAGTWWRQKHVARHTTTVPQRLQDAGFIILANTSCSQLGMWYDLSFSMGPSSENAGSDSKLRRRGRHGSTLSAYGAHSRTPGGSSGGEGAIISAAGAPAGVGSDIGGSIRLPAGFCGVFGHKGTGGYVPNTGQNPTTFHPFMATGPMARFSDDLVVLLELMRGADGIDTCCLDMRLVEAELPLMLKVSEGAAIGALHADDEGGDEGRRATTPEAVETASPSSSGNEDDKDNGDDSNEDADDAELLLVDRTGGSGNAAHSLSGTTVNPAGVGVGVSAAGLAGKLKLKQAAPSLSAASSRPLTIGGRPSGGLTSDPLNILNGARLQQHQAHRDHRLAAIKGVSSSSEGLGSSTQPVSRQPAASASVPHHNARETEEKHLGISPVKSESSSASAGQAGSERGRVLASSPYATCAPPAKLTSWGDVTVWVVADIDARPPLMPRVRPYVKKAVAAAVHKMTGRHVSEATRYDPQAVAAEPSASSAASSSSSSSSYGCKGPFLLDLPELSDAFDLWSSVLSSSDQPSFKDLLGVGYGGTVEVGKELLLWCFGKSNSTLPALILALIEDIPGKLMPGRVRAMVDKCFALRSKLADLFTRTNGVLICPFYPTTAPLPEAVLLRPFAIHWTALFNVLEFPATVCPMGINAEDGLPVAIQVVGAPLYDRLTIGVAQALEHGAVAGWVPPGCISTCAKCRFDGTAEPDWSLLPQRTRKRLAQLGMREALLPEDGLTLDGSLPMADEVDDEKDKQA